MGRIKSNKQYSIRITHPIHGVFYYSHFNWDKMQYIFTQKLSSVSKWKTKKIVEQNISEMVQHTTNSRNIVFQVGVVKDDDTTLGDIELGQDMFVFRKRIYQKVRQVIKKSEVSESSDEMLKIYDTLKLGLKELNELFGDDSFIDVQYEKDTKSIFNRFVQNMNMYNKHQNRVIKATKLRKNNQLVYIDLVNSSFNFRGLKLKTLTSYGDD